jgi:soluble lytic murein transglycosylase-like protein
MNIKVLSYVDESYLGETQAVGAESASVSGTCESQDSFAEILEDAKAQKLMEIDAAIAQAKLSGASGLSVNSALARELGVDLLSGSDTSTVSTVTETSSDSSVVSTDGSSAEVLSESSSGSSDLVTSEELDEIFAEAAATYGVDEKLLKAVAKVESNFNASAVSSAGAVGIMQLMPATAAGLGVSDSYDARENIFGGAKYLSQLLAKYDGDTSLALAAYNAGSARVDQYGGIPPYTETQNYVKKVLGYYQS